MKERIKYLARSLGFSGCGFASTTELTSERTSLMEWLASGFHANMNYMENHFEKRLNPSLLVEGSKTVISLTFPYFPDKIQDSSTFQIAKYAYGEDYHDVLKDKLRILLEQIDIEFGPVSGRVFTDSAPILERPLAVRSGLGWIGRNSLLITKESGSFVFIAEILCDLSIDPDTPFDNNFCGTCRACIDNCPTSAIIADGVIDSNRCLSYWTIEHKGEIPEEIQNLNRDRMYGCDICQDVCPWNRRAQKTTEPRFQPHPELLEFTNEDWKNLTENEYSRLFKKSAVKRAKFGGLRRNIDSLTSQL